jgi:serine/threonine-protein kinase
MDRRTDVYSLGATLYDIFTNQPPFTGDTGIDVIMDVMRKDPEPLKKYNPTLPSDLEIITMKCLEKDPQRRYDSAKALAEDLQHYLDGEPIQARRASLKYRVTKWVKRRKALVAISAISLIAIIMLASIAGYSKYTSIQQARMAEQFGKDIKEIETIARYAYMLPLHNTRNEINLIKDRMDKIRHQMYLLGRSSDGPGNYALGRGYLALFDYPHALERLQASWDAGYRSADLEYALGIALGKMYYLKEQEANATLSNEQLQARNAQIKQDYLDNAIIHLKKAREAGLDSPAYAEGLIAVYESRYKDCVFKADEANEQMSWLFEAKRLKGEAYTHLAQMDMARNNYSECQENLRLAKEAFQQAIEIARSDYSSYNGIEIINTTEMEMDLAQGKSPMKAFQSAIDAMNNAIIAAPDEDVTDYSGAYAYYQLGEYQLRTGESPAGLDKAIELAGIGQRLNPENIYMYITAGLSQYSKAANKVSLGEDPSESFEAATKNFNSAIKLAPKSVPTYINLGNIYWRRSLYEMSYGREPFKLLDQAIESFNKALQINTNSSLSYGNLGNAYEIKAEYELSCGINPMNTLKLAFENYQKALKLNPGFANAKASMGIAYRTQGIYEAMSGAQAEDAFNNSIDCFKDAIKINVSADVYRWLGETYIREAEWRMRNNGDAQPLLTSAQSAIEEALKINPSDFASYLRRSEVEMASAQLARGNARQAKDMFDRAQADITRALSLNNRSAEVFKIAANLSLRRLEQADRNEKLIEEGLAMTDKGLSINPHMAALISIKGGLLVQRARIARGADRLTSAKQAQDSFRQAFQIDALLKNEYKNFADEADQIANSN